LEKEAPDRLAKKRKPHRQIARRKQRGKTVSTRPSCDEAVSAGALNSKPRMIGRGDQPAITGPSELEEKQEAQQDHRSVFLAGIAKRSSGKQKEEEKMC